jgi:DNA-binding CsgD family transcriptional regulator
VDPAIYRIVMSQPVPDKLFAHLRRAPLVPLWNIRYQVNTNLTPNLRATLPLVCEGYTNREIAALRHYSEEAVKDHVKRLLAIFGARRRSHLAALAVARGFVDMSGEA